MNKPNHIKNDINEFSHHYAEMLNQDVLPDLPFQIREQYEILSCLAINHHAETFLLESRENKQKVILKMINTTDKTQWREDFILKDLNHPAIPKLLETVTTKDKTFILRQYFEGKNLSQIMEQGRHFSVRESINIIIQVCDILDYLHSQSTPIIYRDLKPDNIVLGENNQIKLVDFDIARKYNPLTNTDTHYFGTKQYSAPEQFGYKQTDARTDVYALGILLFYLITGDTNLDQLEQLQHHKLRKIINKCTQFAPKDRYPSIQALKSALKSIRFQRLVPLPLQYAFFILLSFAIGFFTGTQSHLPIIGAGIHHYKPDDIITFQNPLLEQAVRETLHRPEDQPVYYADVEEIQSLHLWGDQTINSADKLLLAYNSGFTNVQVFFESYAGESLSIHPGTVESLEELKHFPNLKKLDLVNQQVHDLTPLAELPLEELNIAGNNISDLTPLANIKTLTTLNLNYNPISDLTPLQSLPNLTTLNASDTAIDSVAALQDMTNLRYIYINNAKLVDLSPLSGLELINCYFENNLIQDISSLHCSGDNSFKGNPLISP